MREKERNNERKESKVTRTKTLQKYKKNFQKTNNKCILNKD